jgi:hypothetical protein
MATSALDKEKSINVTTNNIASPSASQDPDASLDTVWETGWKSRFPWLGAIAILCVWISAGAAAILLVLSDNRPQSTWPNKITPNVVLAGINSFSNIMLVIAIGQGIAIAWWRKVLRGATVQDLHYSWGFGTSVLALLKGWRYLNLIALAALAAKIAIVDSILLQRATQTYQANDPSRNVSIVAPHVTSFPISGTRAQGTDNVTIPDYVFQNAIVGPWKGGVLDSATTTAAFDGCNGICEGTLPSVGFSYSCDTVTNSLFRYSDVQPFNLTEQRGSNTSIPVFKASFDMSWANATKNYTSILFDALYYTAQGVDGDCSGMIGHTHCEIRPAMLQADFSIFDYDALSSDAAGTGSTASLQLGWFVHSKTTGKEAGDSSSMARAVNAWNQKGDQLIDYAVESFLPIAEDGGPGNTTMGGIQKVLQQYMGASANLSYDSTTDSWDLRSEGIFADQMLGAYQGYRPGTCEYGSSPATGLYIVQSINNLAMTIATSLTYSTSDSVPSNLTVLETNLGVHYKTSYPFMAAALACMVLCTLLVLPTYWGFWQLGRDVSLAPVEIASAFLAPVLDHPAAGKVVVDDLLVEVGQRKVMFGHLEEQNRLGVLGADSVGKMGKGLAH